MELRIYVDDAGKEPYTDWLNGLKDVRGRAIIRARVTRVESGNFGDCKLLREGVMELRIDFGPGYRVYLSRQGALLVILLTGSDKSDQEKMIEQSIVYLKDWKEQADDKANDTKSAKSDKSGKSDDSKSASKKSARRKL
jgi:putative addiction module killer protein